MPPPTKRVKTNSSRKADDESEQVLLKPHENVSRKEHLSKSPLEIEADISTSLPTFALPTDLRHLTKRHNLFELAINSSSKIRAKVTTLISHLQQPGSDEKTPLAVLHCEAPKASKLISIVEIAKRELEKDGIVWWQYSRVDSVIKEMKQNGNKKGQHTGKLGVASATEDVAVEAIADDINQEDEEEAFETMKPKGVLESRPKIRAVPILVVYMALSKVSALEKEFG